MIPADQNRTEQRRVGVVRQPLRDERLPRVDGRRAPKPPMASSRSASWTTANSRQTSRQPSSHAPLARSLRSLDHDVASTIRQTIDAWSRPSAANGVGMTASAAGELKKGRRSSIVVRGSPVAYLARARRGGRRQLTGEPRARRSHASAPSVRSWKRAASSTMSMSTGSASALASASAVRRTRLTSGKSVGFEDEAAQGKREHDACEHKRGAWAVGRRGLTVVPVVTWVVGGHVLLDERLGIEQELLRRGGRGGGRGHRVELRSAEGTRGCEGGGRDGHQRLRSRAGLIRTYDGVADREKSRAGIDEDGRWEEDELELPVTDDASRAHARVSGAGPAPLSVPRACCLHVLLDCKVQNS